MRRPHDEDEEDDRRRPRDEEEEEGTDWQERMRRRAKEKVSSKSWKIPEGESTFRLLPAAEQGEPPLFEFMQHREVGPKSRMVRCGKSLLGKGKCWLCDVMIPKLKDSASSQERAKGDAMVAKEALVAQVALVDPKTGRFTGPLPWYPPSGGPNALGTKLMSLISREGRKYEHPTKGKNFNISRTGTQKNDTRYGPLEMDDEPSSVPKEILGKLKPWDEIIKETSATEQKNIFFGKDAEDAEEAERPKKRRTVEDDDEDERPKKRRPADEDDYEDEEPPKKKRKPVEDEDEDDDEDERPKKRKPVEDEDDDEDEEPPKKKRKPVEDEDDEEAPPKKRKPPVDEDDDEDERPKKRKPFVDEEDAEEAEEERPKRRKPPIPIQDDDWPDDDDEEAPPKKRKPPVEEEEEEPVKPRKRKPPVEEEEPEPPPRRPVVKTPAKKAPNKKR